MENVIGPIDRFAIYMIAPHQLNLSQIQQRIAKVAYVILGIVSMWSVQLFSLIWLKLRKIEIKEEGKKIKEIHHVSFARQTSGISHQDEIIPIEKQIEEIIKIVSGLAPSLKLKDFDECIKEMKLELEKKKLCFSSFEKHPEAYAEILNDPQTSKIIIGFALKNELNGFLNYHMNHVFQEVHQKAHLLRSEALKIASKNGIDLKQAEIINLIFFFLIKTEFVKKNCSIDTLILQEESFFEKYPLLKPVFTLVKLIYEESEPINNPLEEEKKEGIMTDLHYSETDLIKLKNVLEETVSSRMRDHEEDLFFEPISKEMIGEVDQLLEKLKDGNIYQKYKQVLNDRVEQLVTKLYRSRTLSTLVHRVAAEAKVGLEKYGVVKLFLFFLMGEEFEKEGCFIREILNNEKAQQIFKDDRKLQPILFLAKLLDDHLNKKITISDLNQQILETPSKNSPMSRKSVREIFNKRVSLKKVGISKGILAELNDEEVFKKILIDLIDGKILSDHQSILSKPDTSHIKNEMELLLNLLKQEIIYQNYKDYKN
jgi:hypothetical protein